MNLKNTMKAIFMALFIAGFSYAATAQGKLMKKANGVVGFIYNYNVGYTLNNYDALNTALKNNGALELPKGNLLYGFDYSFFLNNVVIGGGFNYNNSKKEEDNSLLKLKTREGYFKLGYVVFSTKKFFVYPTIGIGRSTLKLDYTDSTSSKNFNNFASLNGRATHLTAKPLTLNAELNLMSTGKAGGVSLILGYTTTPQSVLWRSNDIKIGGNPNWRYSHMYAKLALGFGKIMKMKRPKMKKLEEIEDDIMDIESDEDMDGAIKDAAKEAVDDAANAVIDATKADAPTPVEIVIDKAAPVEGIVEEGIDVIKTKGNTKIEDKNLNEKVKVFVRVQQKPKFPGGDKALRTFLANNLAYPKTVKKLKSTKTVYVKFSIMKDGSIKNIKALNPDKQGFSKEAVRVIKLMASKYKYIPGSQGGKKVEFGYNIPVLFIPNGPEDDF